MQNNLNTAFERNDAALTYSIVLGIYRDSELLKQVGTALLKTFALLGLVIEFKETTFSVANLVKTRDKKIQDD